MKELPSLPEMNLWFQGMPVNPEAFQNVMLEYGALCCRKALEDAAKFCESQQVNHSPRGTRLFLPFDMDCQATHEGMHYAKAIREILR